MLVLKRLTAAAVTIGALTAILFAVLGTAWAGDGQPSAWQTNFQLSATPVMDEIVSFHTWLLYTITAIAGFVLGVSGVLTTGVPLPWRQPPPPALEARMSRLFDVAALLCVVTLVGSVAVALVRGQM